MWYIKADEFIEEKNICQNEIDVAKRKTKKVLLSSLKSLITIHERYNIDRMGYEVKAVITKEDLDKWVDENEVK
jgi:hypothetical protein